MSERLSHGPKPEIQPLPEYVYPTPKDMRFTEPVMSEAARGVEDPRVLVKVRTATGHALVTRSELNKDKKIMPLA